MTQISLTLLSTKVREKHSPKHLSGGKGAYEYVIFWGFFSKYKWKQITNEAEMFGLVSLLH